MEKNMGLSGLIHAQFKTESEFADKIGWSRQKLSRILLGKQGATIPDVQDLSDGLGVPFMMVAKFFLE